MASSPPDRKTERGEMMRYFLEQLNPGRAKLKLKPLTYARLGRLLVKIPTSDLYYLKSVCDDAAARNGAGSFSKRFWWEIKPKPATEPRPVERAEDSDARR